MLWILGEPEFEPLRQSVPRSGIRLAETVHRLLAGATDPPRRTPPGPMPASRGCHALIEQTIAHHVPVPGEIRAFSKCRNERLRLPAFLDHYRHLGVDRFFIVDNDSSDGTTEYLAAQPDVHLFQTTGRFSEARGGTDWLNALLRDFGVGSWCVTVDIDELLVYPGSEQTGLRPLTKFLDRGGYEALSCLLLDLYPAGPLGDCKYRPGDDLVAAAPYFDPAGYVRSQAERCPGVFIRGGMRQRVFYTDFNARGVLAKLYDAVIHRAAPLRREMPWLPLRRRPAPPCLTKVPLVRWDQTSEYLNCNHWVSPKKVAPETGALLHFKFLHDFHDRAVQEVARAEYYDGACEYQRYARWLNRNPALALANDASVRFEATSQLVRLGLMLESDAWRDARRTSDGTVGEAIE
jgi:hypothetical protein